MEEILNRIIEIDNNAKAIVQDGKKRKEQIEDIIEKEYKRQKELIDNAYKEEIDSQKKSFEVKLREKEAIEDMKARNEISRIETDFKKSEQEIIDNIINSIKGD